MSSWVTALAAMEEKIKQCVMCHCLLSSFNYFHFTQTKDQKWDLPGLYYSKLCTYQLSETGMHLYIIFH